MKTIFTDKAPAAVGPYSQAKVVGGLLFASGQIPLDPKTGSIVAGGIVEQTEQVCKNIDDLYWLKQVVTSPKLLKQLVSWLILLTSKHLTKCMLNISLLNQLVLA